MAQRMEFGRALDDDDVLVVQGVEYRMQPIGMRAMRLMLRANVEEGATPEQRIDAAIELIAAAVRPEERDRLREHIENSVPPQMVTEIALAIGRSSSDLDPTQPASSSDGSSPTGPNSTDGAALMASTP